MPPPALEIDPPLLNSANPWATDLRDLTELYNCRHTGAVTTRTSLIKGFNHDPEVHQHVFFDPATHRIGQGSENASLNSLGYSPHTLDEYLGFIREMASGAPPNSSKCFIVSVTGTPEDVVECYRRIAAAQEGLPVPLAMEINLSCPNIPGAPPPAYDGAALGRYLELLAAELRSSELPRVPFGLKTPPYTHSTEFAVLITALAACASRAPDGICPASFITATNTLGSCMVLPPRGETADQVPAPALPGPGTGGMAGAPLHPLALGNVATLRRMLAEPATSAALGHVRVVGVGGVLDAAGYTRMRSVGAYAVGVGTGLGIKGVGVFGEIAGGLGW